jgi:hypothetical protein
MPTRDRSARGARTLSGKRRLHPLAILFPLSSYSRPPRLGQSLRLPRWVVVAILFVVILILDYFSVDVTVRDDGAVLYQNSNFTWETWGLVLLGFGGVIAYLVVRWWTFR